MLSNKPDTGLGETANLYSFPANPIAIVDTLRTFLFLMKHGMQERSILSIFLLMVPGSSNTNCSWPGGSSLIPIVRSASVGMEWVFLDEVEPIEEIGVVVPEVPNALHQMSIQKAMFYIMEHGKARLTIEEP